MEVRQCGSFRAPCILAVGVSAKRDIVGDLGLETDSLSSCRVILDDEMQFEALPNILLLIMTLLVCWCCLVM